MKQYLDLLKTILDKGVTKESGRAGMPNTKGVFGYQMRFDLSEGFPLLTTKKMSFKSIAHELIWFLRGETNIKYLVDNGVKIWNGDAYRHYKNKCKQMSCEPHFQENEFIDAIRQGIECDIPNYRLGDLGEVYGSQWRKWAGVSNSSSGGFDKTLVTIDQIKKVIDGIKKNPFGRRHIVSAWNPAEVDNMALPPCHLLFQFNCRPIDNLTRLYSIGDFQDRDETISNTRVKEKEKEISDKLDKLNAPKFYLDCALTQRSCDSFLGVPYNIASYALLTEIIAKICNMVAGEFVWTGNDTHIYSTHETAVQEQLTREPMELCELKVSDRVLSFNDISELTIEDLSIENYNSHPAIKAELSVGI